MSGVISEPLMSQSQVVDLCTVTPAELEGLWRHEAQWWREHLFWDISHPLEVLRRVIGRRGVPGKAVRVGTQTVGYTYYVISGSLGILSGLVVAPAWNSAEVGEGLLQATVDAIRQRGVQRIESPCMSMASPWLVPVCERAGLRTAWRAFLRVDLAGANAPVPSPALVELEPWQERHIHEAAAIMQAAYRTTVDVQLNMLYRTVEGCSSVLDNLQQQGGCGPLVAEASVFARARGQGIGFVVVTEIAPRQGHLAQVAVLPAYQRQGVGRLLVHHCLTQLAARHFDTLSLIVSRENQHAFRLYQAMGLQEILAFPVFVWEQLGSDY
jgi:ribosomal protein S18 acetylase RimI-like enzyme